VRHADGPWIENGQSPAGRFLQNINCQVIENPALAWLLKGIKLTGMFSNYLLPAWRTFRRNRLFTLINVLGLSIGISASVVIYLIAHHEFSYDRFEKDGDRIFRVVMDPTFSGTTGHSGAVPAPLSKAVREELRGVDLTVPIFKYQGEGTAKVAVAGMQREQPTVFPKQEAVIYIGPEYFDLIPHQWLAGSAASSLSEPFTVVLTESRARLYFPSMAPANVVGRQLTYDDMTVTVTGIVRDLHALTDIRGSEFISFATIAKTRLTENFMMNEWNDWMAYSQLYIKLAKGIDRRNAEAQLAGLYKKYGRHDPQHPGDGFSFRLLPLKEIHFNADYAGFTQRIASKPTLYGLLAVAGFLLLLACLNFINLSTAQAIRRAKEIGIRKTMGSSRVQLIRQFLGETFVLVAVSTALSVALTPLLLSAFAGFIPPDLHPEWLEHPDSLFFLLGLTFGITALAGFYPAFLLSGFNPVRVLKDGWFTADGRASGTWLRRTFTVSQFVIAQFFIIATLMVGKQIRYSLNGDLGFRKTAVLTFNIPRDTVAAHQAALLDRINAIPQVERAATGFQSPADGETAFGNISYKPRPDIQAQVLIRWGDTNYIPLYDIRLLAGRNVRQSDTAREVLINASYAKLLGFHHPDDALGMPLSVNGKNLPIVGVMADFHEQSMHNAIGPLAFEGMPGHTVHIRLKSGPEDRAEWSNAIEKMQKAFAGLYPGADWDYAFLDDDVAKWYKSEQDMAHLLYWATALTILISCLGLLGLVIYTTNMRTREIGIRKVLGASISAIVSILSGEFVRLVLLAFLIAVPAAWWASNRWLQGFAYRTPMNWWVFAFGGFLLLLFALITLSFQTIRAALANPVRSLRSE
jgi:putative ABC transport system permease protein